MSDFYDHIYRSYGTYGGVPNTASTTAGGFPMPNIKWGDESLTDPSEIVADFTVDAAGDRVYCITTAT